jgi:hypothetical protein
MEETTNFSINNNWKQKNIDMIMNSNMYMNMDIKERSLYNKGI